MSSPTRYAFTVCTPTYNRAHTLPRVFDSLMNQTFCDFEWLIVDDGSTDGTAALVNSWQQEAPFPIRYFWQENSGMGVAVNKGIDEARGALFLILDSDDACLPAALERLKSRWDEIPLADQPRFVGVTGLVQTPDGKVVGTPFPSDVLDSDSLEIRIRYGVKGEKWGCQRTDVLRTYKFPLLGGEKNEAPSVLWNRIALTFETRFINEVVRTHHDTPGSRSSLSNRVDNSLRGWFYYREFMWLDYQIPLRWRLRINANFVRYSLHSGIGILKQASEVKNRVEWMSTLPSGTLVFLLDKIRLAKPVPAVQELIRSALNRAP